MALPRPRDAERLPTSAPSALFEAADPSARAGGYTVAQLEALLSPVLQPDALHLAEQAKWPLGYSFALVFGVSALMWSAIISGLTWLF